ncbi:Uncharacterized protein Fot_37717 [Forsythia ovata]|uniref:Uncharacterized protein n=1 Tax=Forsythia ovata TaxID=205694 RepID=A0ABD1RZU3_9LAMI
MVDSVVPAIDQEVPCHSMGPPSINLYCAHLFQVVDIVQMLDEMLTQKIKNTPSKRKDNRRQMVLKKDSFALEIMDVPLLKGFEQSMIESYDGIIDPLDHI